MKSAEPGLTPDVVNNLLASKSKLVEIQKNLTSMNILFKEITKKGDRPSVEQIKVRKKTKADFTQMQQAYNIFCGQINDHKEVLKQIRLGKLSLVDDGSSLSLIVNTGNTKNPVSFDLSHVLPTSLGFADYFY